MKKRMLSLAVLAASLFCFSNGANAQKTEKLFNGKDLSNWNFVVDKNSVPADQVYSVRDGKIFITGQPFGYMYTKEKYSDYKIARGMAFGRMGIPTRTAVSSCISQT